MRHNNLTVKRILAKLAQNQRLTHDEELFYLVEVLYLSEEKAERLLSSQELQARKVKMHPSRLAKAA